MTEFPAVAIVGMSGRFPGAADVTELWDLLSGAGCAISDFDEADLLAQGQDPAEVRHPAHVPSRGFLAEADRFEAPLFGFNRSEAAVLDPQHRLLLETAWSALEDAGYNPRRAPDRTGVYVGGGSTEHAAVAALDRQLAADFGELQLRVLTDREFLAPWLSYKLNLNGPSLNVQTACSTSLAAVHLAAQALLLGECDAALAGGVSVDCVSKRGYRYQDGGIASPDGRCRPFDESSAGTVPGSGVGLVLLRRLEDALADGDRIRAVIRGGAVTNDAATRVGFTAPGVDRQTAAITEAWATAGLDPSAAQYIEMHGTGTALGDRIELAAVTAALAAAPATPCAIGSIKSNLGHLDAAAGIAGLIKVVLMMENKLLAPTVNVTRPRPELESAGSPLSLVTSARPWDRPARGGPRLAGVTSIGIGGTNVHLALEESPDTAPAAPTADPDLWHILPLSACTERQLAIAAERLAACLESPRAPALADAALTLQGGRADLASRGYVIARTAADAAIALRALARTPSRSSSPAAAPAEFVKIAETWLTYAAVNWPAPARGARRARLPTYPFLGDRYAAFTTPSAPGVPAETPAPGTESAAPDVSEQDVSEHAVSNLVMQSLGLAAAADLDLTFFGAGGDSLAAIHLVDRLEQELGLDVPLERFLNQLTLRELVQAILAPTAPHTEDDLLAALLTEIESGS